MDVTPDNQETQATSTMPVFNNWNVVAEAWYVALESKDLVCGQARSVNICDHQITLFRGFDGSVRALDAFCPHMGTDLGIGKVVGNEIQCIFHHWKFNGEGECVDIPCQKEIPVKARLKKYKTEEKFGFIWVYPSSESSAYLPSHEELAELSDEEIIFKTGKAYERKCHHHVTMINGIDAQHLRTVHGIQIHMDLNLKASTDENVMDFSLRGAIPQTNFKEKLARTILGTAYEYKMRYAAASIGFLTMMKGVYFLNNPRWKLPELYMIFAYRPETKRQKTFVQPIYVTKRRRGLFGFLVSGFLLWLTKRAFFALQDEDGMIYENIRFFPNTLLAIDRPVAKFIEYVNKLKPSVWSK
jgi:phenylpropionate dioxygenase-like ring-hydroxylating dioxygenase large terminal subunit